MLTAVLSRADVLRNVQALHLLNEMREAVAAVAQHELQLPTAREDGRLTARIGQHPKLPMSTATIWSSAQAVMHVYQNEPPRLIAMLDATRLLDIATSLLLATAVDILAPQSIEQVAILGGGEPATQTLKALRLVRSIERTALYETDLAANTELAFRLKKSLDAAIVSADSSGQAVENAEVVIVTKGNALPFGRPKPGAIVCVDDDGRFTPESAPSWLKEARLVSDGSVDFTAFQLRAEQLGNVMAETQRETVSVFVTRQPTWVDALAGWHVCEGLKRDEQVTRLALEA